MHLDLLYLNLKHQIVNNYILESAKMIYIVNEPYNGPLQNLIIAYKILLSWVLDHLISRTKCLSLSSKCHKWDNNEFQIESHPSGSPLRVDYSQCNIAGPSLSKLGFLRGVYQIVTHWSMSQVRNHGNSRNWAVCCEDMNVTP